MPEDRELIAAIAATLMVLFFFINRSKVAAAPHARLLVASFSLMAASLVCSVVEVFFWEEQINFVQHALASLSMVTLAVWAWLTFVANDGVSA